MTKNWCCLICHRSGDEITLADAELRHRNMLAADRQSNDFMKARFGAFSGPSITCRGNLKLREVVKRGGKRIATLVFGDDVGDPWIETGARLKVNGKVIESEE